MKLAVGESLLAGFPEETERLGREQDAVRLSNTAVCLVSEADAGTSTGPAETLRGDSPGIWVCSGWLVLSVPDGPP